MATANDERQSGGTQAAPIGGEPSAKTFPLSEGEVLALRKHAEWHMLFATGERLRWYDAEKCGGSPDETRAEATERMMAAAEVYGACRNAETAFRDGLKPAAEAAKVEFTDKALIWMGTQRSEIRNGLESARGTVEVNIDSTPTETFLLFVLDGVCEGASDRG